MRRATNLQNLVIPSDPPAGGENPDENGILLRQLADQDDDLKDLWLASFVAFDYKELRVS